jgi:hypothetical protein
MLQRPPLRPHRLHIPPLPPLLIIEHPRPRELQGRRQLPRQLLIPQPQPHQMPFMRLVVLVRLARVQHRQVVDEADIALPHRSLEAVLRGDEVHGVEGFGLSFGERRQAGGARRGGVACQ